MNLSLKRIFDEKNIYFAYCVFFILFTIPRSVEVLLPVAYKIINVLKILSCAFIIIMLFKNKPSISILSKGIIIYIIYLGISTVFNKVNPITFLKVYSLNISIILLCELIFNSKYKNKFIYFFSNYFLLLLMLNFIGILLNFIFTGSFQNPENIYVLGQDNRFILYILPTLLGFYFSLNNNKQKVKIIKRKLYLTYAISMITLITLWCVASFIILFFVGLGYILSKVFKRVKINIYFVCTIIFIICFMIVFFKVQNIFKDFIVDVLHKSTTLSYRTIIWDKGLSMLKNSPINSVFGFGYYDTTEVFKKVYKNSSLNHLHNIIMDPLFVAGIIGVILYWKNFHKIQKSIDNISNNRIKNTLTISFASLLFLLIFDTFEMYAIYYFLLYLLYISPNIIENKQIEKIDENNTKIIKSMKNIIYKINRKGVKE